MSEELNQTAVKYFTDRLSRRTGMIDFYGGIGDLIDMYNLEYERDGLHLTYMELESEKLIKISKLSDTAVQVYITREGVDFIKMMQDFKRV